MRMIKNTSFRVNSNVRGWDGCKNQMQNASSGQLPSWFEPGYSDKMAELKVNR